MQYASSFIYVDIFSTIAVFEFLLTYDMFALVSSIIFICTVNIANLHWLMMLE